MTDYAKAKEAQDQFCKKANLPNYAGGGMCPNCLNNIFDYVSVEYASKYLITRCPCCSNSLCN